MLYLIIDEASHSFDLQHVGLMSSQLVNKSVCSSVVPTNTGKKNVLNKRNGEQKGLHVFLVTATFFLKQTPKSLLFL